MRQHPVIIVGTTPDYVTRIQKEEREKYLLFLLDVKYTDSCELRITENSNFLFSDLQNFNETLEMLNKYLSEKGNKHSFACFDCEALYLTSKLAEYFNCSFPSSEAILKSRNKFSSHRLWVKKGVNTPKCELASNIEDTLMLFERYNENVVIKPLSGSGSELVFHCTEKIAVIKAVKVIKNQLENRRDNPLFSLVKEPLSGEMIDPCSLWLVEEYIPGPEYSCDFFMANGNIQILRETGKIKDSVYPFGTVSGYIIPAQYSEKITGDDVKIAMMNAAVSLGFTWGYFMADFIVKSNQIYMIELTPRPGGDSLPDLLRESTGTDILKTYLDIITGDTGPLETYPEPSGCFASIHFYTEREGVIVDIDTGDILSDPRFRFILLKKNRGDRVSLPPGDYDNRLIGYCIISGDDDICSLMVCKDIQKKLKVTYATPS